LKKPAGSVSQAKNRKNQTEPKPKKKPSQNRKNRAKTEKTKKKTESNQFEPVFALKNQTENDHP
jgi:hypothetical protein